MENINISILFDNLLAELFNEEKVNSPYEFTNLVDCVLEEKSFKQIQQMEESPKTLCLTETCAENDNKSTRLLKELTHESSLDAFHNNEDSPNLLWVSSKLWEDCTNTKREELEEYNNTKKSYHVHQPQIKALENNNSVQCTNLSPISRKNNEPDFHINLFEASTLKSQCRETERQTLFSPQSSLQTELKKISNSKHWHCPKVKANTDIYLDHIVGGFSEKPAKFSKEMNKRSGMKSRSVSIDLTSGTGSLSAKPVIVNLCVESKTSHVGPLQLEIYPGMMLKLLKSKIHNDLGIKPHLQKWIIGNQLVDKDDMNLDVLPSGSFIYLYLENSELDQNKICQYFSQAFFYSTDRSSENIVFNNSPTTECSLLAPMYTRQSANVSEVLKKISRLPEKKDPPKGKQSHLSEKLKSLKLLQEKSSQPSSTNPDLRSQLHQTTVNKFSEEYSNRNDSIVGSATIGTPITDVIKTINTPVPPTTTLSKTDLINAYENTAKSDDVDSLKFGNYIKTDLIEVNNIDNLQCQVEIDSLCTNSNIARNAENTAILIRSDVACCTSTSSMEDCFSTCGSSASLSDIDLKITGNGDSTIKEKRCNLNSNVLQENYSHLLQLDSLSVIPNSVAFDCPICFSSVDTSQGVVLRDCLHMFCKECLECTIIYSPSSLVKCPYRDLQYFCDSSLQQREIKGLVSTEDYEQYLHRCLLTAESSEEKSFHCKTADCSGWCVYEDAINVFLCPICGRYNCLTCQAIHEGFNCRQFQDNLKQTAKLDENAVRTLEFLEQMVKDGKAMNCPKCRVVLMKKWGCDWLKCSVCQTEVCWITKGARWGPQGPGDISAGCKCGVGGKKCHSQCTYCH